MNGILFAATASGVRYLSPLNMGGENNVATWWSGLFYGFAAVHAYEYGRRNDRRDRVIWYPLSIGFVLLMSTEIGSIHERLIRYMGQSIIEIVAGAFVLVCAHSFVRIFLAARTRVTGFYLSAGFFALALTRIQERLEVGAGRETQIVSFLTALEEGTELLAGFLLVTGMLRLTAEGLSTRLLRVLPKWSTGESLSRVTGACLFLVVPLGFYTATQTDLINRGNPSACYPVAVYMLVACLALRKWMIEGGARAAALAVILMFCSADSMTLYVWNFAIYYPNPSAEHSLDIWYQYFSGAFISHVVLVAAWGLGQPGFYTWRRSAILLAMVTGNLTALMLGRREVSMVVATLTAWGVYQLTLHECRTA